MHYELKKLKNKLNTIFLDSPGSTAASVQIWFRAGSALEEKQDAGIAHFLEHMFFKGTKKRPGAEIANAVESFGGEINAFTSFDYTCYYINTPSDKLNDSTDILLDMVSNPQFLMEDLLPERDVVFEEYRRSLDNPNQYGFSQLQKSCFTGKYAHAILGTEKTIKNFSRAQLQKFRKNFYNITNSFLVVAGDLKNKNKITSTIEKYKLPNGSQSKFEAFKVKSKPAIEVHAKDVRMAQLNIVIQAPALVNAVAPAEDLAFNCLGHGETSRLFKNLVLKNSHANASTSSSLFMNNGGAHFIKISFPFENFKKVTEEIKETFAEILSNGFSNDEVNKIKNQYIASKVYEKETIESFSFSLGHGYAQTGDLESEDKFIQRIKETPAHAVNKSFKEVLKRPIHFSMQLPKSDDIKAAKQQLEQFHQELQACINQKSVAKSSNQKVTKSKFDSQVNQLELKPGLTLLYRKNEISPTFVLHAYIKGGLTDETEKDNGIHHILSTMLTKGYNGISYDTIKEHLENKLASLSGFSGKNAYGLTMHGQTADFDQLVPHFIGALTAPDFESKFIEHEKKLTLRTIENQKEDPIKQCFQQVGKQFFNQHAYALSSLGSEKSIKGLNQKMLKSLHDKNLSDREVLITYCGDMELAQVISAIDPIISKFKDKPTKKPTYKPIEAKKPDQTFIPFDREQTQIFIGFPAAPLTHSDNLYLKMIATHLSGQSSKLFVEVRDKKGLCYTAQPVHFNALEGGYWGIYMASGHDKVKAAVLAIDEILDEIKDDGLSKKDFNRLKQMIHGQDKVNIQTNEDYANIYSIAVLHQLGLDQYHENNEMIQKLSYETFQKEIKKLLSQPRSRIVVGKENA